MTSDELSPDTLTSAQAQNPAFSVETAETTETYSSSSNSSNSDSESTEPEPEPEQSSPTNCNTDSSSSDSAAVVLPSVAESVAVTDQEVGDSADDNCAVKKVNLFYLI